MEPKATDWRVGVMWRNASAVSTDALAIKLLQARRGECSSIISRIDQCASENLRGQPNFRSRNAGIHNTHSGHQHSANLDSRQSVNFGPGGRPGGPPKTQNKVSIVLIIPQIMRILCQCDVLAAFDVFDGLRSYCQIGHRCLYGSGQI